MRIGILGPCPPPYGGVTRVIENNARFWKEKNVESYLLPSKIPKNPKPPPGVELVDWRKYLSLNNKFLRIVKESARFLGRRTFPFIRYNLALHNIIREFGIDLLYSHHASSLRGWSSVFQSKLLGIPTVLVSYGETWMETRSHRKLYYLQRFVLQNADLVISTSEHCRRGAVNIGADPLKTRVVYAGIDVNKFSPAVDGGFFRRRHGICEDKIVISTLGLALRRKMTTFVECLPFLRKYEKRINVLIGGVGKDYEYFKALLQKSNFSFVKLLGFIPDDELPSFYNATDIFVVSPRTKIECMGQTMKEAMACGVPVVGADIGGVPEAIVNGETGLLFSPGNARDLAVKIEMLIGDEDLRKRLGDKAREVACEKFDARMSAEKTLKIFKELLS